jgi:hypothetical protein
MIETLSSPSVHSRGEISHFYHSFSTEEQVQWYLELKSMARDILYT